MSDITPKIEAQMVRIMDALDRALVHAARQSAAKGAQPGLAADYARRHPAATVADIVAATGCSRTTARDAWRARPNRQSQRKGEGNDGNHRL